ncbi:unnamed protein product [Amoebophrya sp. A25]|nr:unnamed protein product [Amoebophrya sp. A25]|eukprot:GSA25T00016048001.1
MIGGSYRDARGGSKGSPHHLESFAAFADGRDFQTYYAIGKKIGFGGFGAVYRCEERRIHGAEIVNDADDDREDVEGRGGLRTSSSTASAHYANKRERSTSSASSLTTTRTKVASNKEVLASGEGGPTTSSPKVASNKEVLASGEGGPTTSPLPGGAHIRSESQNRETPDRVVSRDSSRSPSASSSLRLRKASSRQHPATSKQGSPDALEGDVAATREQEDRKMIRSSNYIASKNSKTDSTTTSRGRSSAKKCDHHHRGGDDRHVDGGANAGRIYDRDLCVKVVGAEGKKSPTLLLYGNEERTLRHLNTLLDLRYLSPCVVKYLDFFLDQHQSVSSGGTTSSRLQLSSSFTSFSPAPPKKMYILMEELRGPDLRQVLADSSSRKVPKRGSSKHFAGKYYGQGSLAANSALAPAAMGTTAQGVVLGGVGPGMGGGASSPNPSRFPNNMMNQHVGTGVVDVQQQGVVLGVPGAVAGRGGGRATSGGTMIYENVKFHHQQNGGATAAAPFTPSRVPSAFVSPGGPAGQHQQQHVSGTSMGYYNYDYQVSPASSFHRGFHSAGAHSGGDESHQHGHSSFEYNITTSYDYGYAFTDSANYQGPEDGDGHNNYASRGGHGHRGSWNSLEDPAASDRRQQMGGGLKGAVGSAVHGLFDQLEHVLTKLMVSDAKGVAEKRRHSLPVLPPKPGSFLSSTSRQCSASSAQIVRNRTSSRKNRSSSKQEHGVVHHDEHLPHQLPHQGTAGGGNVGHMLGYLGGYHRNDHVGGGATCTKNVPSRGHGRQRGDPHHQHELPLHEPANRSQDDIDRGHMQQHDIDRGHMQQHATLLRLSLGNLQHREGQGGPPGNNLEDDDLATHGRGASSRGEPEPERGLPDELSADDKEVQELEQRSSAGLAGQEEEHLHQNQGENKLFGSPCIASTLPVQPSLPCPLRKPLLLQEDSSTTDLQSASRARSGPAEVSNARKRSKSLWEAISSSGTESSEDPEDGDEDEHNTTQQEAYRGTRPSLLMLGLGRTGGHDGTTTLLGQIMGINNMNMIRSTATRNKGNIKNNVKRKKMRRDLYSSESLVSPSKFVSLNRDFDTTTGDRNVARRGFRGMLVQQQQSGVTSGGDHSASITGDQHKNIMGSSFMTRNSFSAGRGEAPGAQRRSLTSTNTSRTLFPEGEQQRATGSVDAGGENTVSIRSSTGTSNGNRHGDMNTTNMMNITAIMTTSTGSKLASAGEEHRITGSSSASSSSSTKGVLLQPGGTGSSGSAHVGIGDMFSSKNITGASSRTSGSVSVSERGSSGGISSPCLPDEGILVGGATYASPIIPYNKKPPGCSTPGLGSIGIGGQQRTSREHNPDPPEGAPGGRTSSSSRDSRTNKAARAARQDDVHLVDPGFGAWEGDPVLNLDFLRRLMGQMAEAVAVVHAAGMIHRDLKIENFKFRDPSLRQLVLLDFGLASLHDDNEEERLARAAGVGRRDEAGLLGSTEDLSHVVLAAGEDPFVPAALGLEQSNSTNVVASSTRTNAGATGATANHSSPDESLGPQDHRQPSAKDHSGCSVSVKQEQADGSSACSASSEDTSNLRKKKRSTNQLKKAPESSGGSSRAIVGTVVAQVASAKGVGAFFDHFEQQEHKRETSVCVGEGSPRREQEGERNKNLVGTLCNMAPEVLSRRQYSPASDLWALGTIYYELIAGATPFDVGSVEMLRDMHWDPVLWTGEVEPAPTPGRGATTRSLSRSRSIGGKSSGDVKLVLGRTIREARFWDKAGKDAVELVQKLLTRDVKCRLSDAMQVVRHTFLREYCRGTRIRAKINRYLLRGSRSTAAVGTCVKLLVYPYAASHREFLGKAYRYWVQRFYSAGRGTEGAGQNQIQQEGGTGVDQQRQQELQDASGPRLVALRIMNMISRKTAPIRATFMALLSWWWLMVRRPRRLFLLMKAFIRALLRPFVGALLRAGLLPLSWTSTSLFLRAHAQAFKGRMLQNAMVLLPSLAAQNENQRYLLQIDEENVDSRNSGTQQERHNRDHQFEDDNLPRMLSATPSSDRHASWTNYANQTSAGAPHQFGKPRGEPQSAEKTPIARQGSTTSSRTSLLNNTYTDHDQKSKINHTKDDPKTRRIMDDVPCEDVSTAPRAGEVVAPRRDNERLHFVLSGFL